MIRFREIRPQLLPAWVGMSSENSAYRVSVEWDQDGERHEGVFIPRRATNSWVNKNLGGTVFPGVFERSRFLCVHDGSRYSDRAFRTSGETEVSFSGRVVATLPDESVFSSLAEASDFFLSGSTGYSATRKDGQFHGMNLEAKNWKVEPMIIEEAFSDFFSDHERFPEGSVEPDCALLMREIVHEWKSKPDLFVLPDGKLSTRSSR